MKFKILVVLCFIGTALSYAQQDDDTPVVSDTLILDLAECRSMALESSELVKIADENINKATYSLKVARSAYLPNVKATALGMYNKQSYSKTLMLPTMVYNSATEKLVPNLLTDASGNVVTGPDGNPIFNTYAYMPLDISSRGGFLAGITAEQPLYAGGKIAAGNHMAKIGNVMADDNKELKQTESIYEADQAYYLYYSTQEKVELAETYRDLLEQLYKVVNDSYETGMTNRNDLLKVKVQLNDAKLNVQKAKNGLELSRMSLCRVLGMPYETPIVITDSLDDYSLDAVNLNNEDVSNRLEYQLLESQVEMAEQDVKMTRGDYMPTAGVSVGYNYYNIDLEDMDNYDDMGLNVVAKVEIPITTFGERKGKVGTKKSEASIKRLELERAKHLMKLEIEQARFNYQDAKMRVDMCKEALVQADENKRITQDSYEVGMETIVNLLEAQASWQKAYSDLIDAKTDCKLKITYYLKVTNQLTLN